MLIACSTIFHFLYDIGIQIKKIELIRSAFTTPKQRTLCTFRCALTDGEQQVVNPSNINCRSPEGNLIAGSKVTISISFSRVILPAQLIRRREKTIL